MEKRHRVFIAINLPEDIRKFLTKYQEKFADVPAKWTSKDNLHITLEFLGFLSDPEIANVCKIAKEVVKNYNSFSINLNKIIYGPQYDQSRALKLPKMIWAMGEKSKELSELKNNLQKALLESVSFSPESREFTPHVTLARIKEWEFKTIEPEERPEINENIDMVFSTETIEVMESVARRGGHVYTTLESCPLNS